MSKKPFIIFDAENFRISPFGIPTPKGYEVPINKQTGEKLPNCCEGHKQVFSETKKWFNKFPNCCDEHKKLSKNKWFNKQDYKDLPEKIINQLSINEFFQKKHVIT